MEKIPSATVRERLSVRSHFAAACERKKTIPDGRVSECPLVGKGELSENAIALDNQIMFRLQKSVSSGLRREKASPPGSTCGYLQGSD
jgi:hypothetical protein